MKYGVCDACGQTGELDERVVKMSKTVGKTKVITESFRCALCTTCQAKLYRRTVYSALSVCLGAACAFAPLLWTPAGAWLLKGQMYLALGLPFLIVAVFVYALTRCDGHVLARHPDYQRLSARDLSPVNALLLSFLQRFACAFALASAVLWAGAAGMRAHLDGWSEQRARVTHSDSRVIRERKRNSSQVVGCRTCASFSYAYERGGRKHTGSGFGHLYVAGSVPAENPWTVESAIRIWCDPASPERSVADKIEPQLFRTAFLIAGLLSGLLLIAGGLRTFVANRMPAHVASGEASQEIARFIEAAIVGKTKAPALAPTPEPDAVSNLLPLGLEVVAFAAGFGSFVLWDRLCPNGDPIFRHYMPFYGKALAITVGAMCASVGVAMRPHRFPPSRAREYGLAGGVLSVAFAFHLLCAYIFFGNGMAFAACLAGFVMRCVVFLGLGMFGFLISGLLAALGFLAFPSLRAVLSARSVTARKYVDNLVHLIGWTGVFGLLAYEMFVAFVFLNRGWWAGA